MSSEIERRLRAAYEASDSLVIDSPLQPDLDVASADPLRVTARPRRRGRRAPLLAAVAVLIIAVGTLLAVDRARSERTAAPPISGTATSSDGGPSASPASSAPSGPGSTPRVPPGEPPPPPLVQAKTHFALTTNTIHRLDQPVQWVKTTTYKWGALEYPRVRPGGPVEVLPDLDMYVVQIRGAFVCIGCKSVQTVTGTVMILEALLEPHPPLPEGGFIMGNTSYDLSRIGTVHVFNGS